MKLGEVCKLKREEAALHLLFSNYKPHQKWVKKKGQPVRVSFGKKLLHTYRIGTLNLSEVFIFGQKMIKLKWEH